MHNIMREFSTLFTFYLVCHDVLCAGKPFLDPTFCFHRLYCRTSGEWEWRVYIRDGENIFTETNLFRCQKWVIIHVYATFYKTSLGLVPDQTRPPELVRSGQWHPPGLASLVVPPRLDRSDHWEHWLGAWSSRNIISCGAWVSLMYLSISNRTSWSNC